jgi:biotin synthase
MNIRRKTKDMIGSVFDDRSLQKDEILYLLEIDLFSVEAGFIMAAANILNREASEGKAEVHAQIGLNLSPCPNHCAFCAFSAENGLFKERIETEPEEILRLSLKAEAEGANALFLMSTGDYPLDRFLERSREVRRNLKPDTVMIANIGDFKSEDGKRLKEAGFAGIYHAVRMGEGKDTSIDPKTRLETIRAAGKAGLQVGTCVEPIGPEHSIEEIAEKILIGREIKPCYSGAMRRIPVPGSRLEKFGMISEYRLAYLVAVVRLAMGPEVRGNCTHEPNVLGATAGANLFWAEAGSNPRDTEAETSKGRGLGVKTCVEMFREADFKILQGPSVIYRGANPE